tara:strand:+ start:20695 stop:21384 length:690 start_codon:yes stop_codon:yes gene_type:complete
MADNWNEHQLKFAPAEPLEKDEISIRVLGHDDKSNRSGHVQQRATVLSCPTSVEQLMAREKISKGIKSDPAYTFLMMVSAFSGRRLGKLMTGSTPTTTSGASERGCEMSDNLCSNNGDAQFKGLQIPAISGVIHLSNEIFGHIKEAQSIANHVIAPNTTLNTLMETPRYQTLFARLVALRMGLSSTLTNSGYHKDKVYTRLHREQTMVMNSLKKVRVVARRTWTEPGYD